jgi:hypothetical protein
MKCLEITTPDAVYTIYMLNPGEHFPMFGGSHSGLTVGRTASMILSRRNAMTRHDTEMDIHDPSVWRFIADAINGKHKGKITAKAASPESEKTDTPAPRRQKGRSKPDAKPDVSKPYQRAGKAVG